MARLRCRGDNHKPNCAHLGLDPSRKYCRGDKHRMGCEHLGDEKPRVVGRPRVNRVRAAALRREANKRAKSGLISQDDPQYPSRVASDHAPHETPPEIEPYQGTVAISCDRCFVAPAAVIVGAHLGDCEWLCGRCAA